MGTERGLHKDLASIQQLQQSSTRSEKLKIHEIWNYMMLEEVMYKRLEVIFHASTSFWAREAECAESFSRDKSLELQESKSATIMHRMAVD